MSSGFGRRPNPPPLLRYASCAAELTPANEVKFKLSGGVQTKWRSNKFRANAWWYVLQSEVKGEASAWPKPEDMSGAVHATKHLHRQPSRITTPKANEKKLLSATLKLNHLSPFTQRQQTRLRINTQLGARVSDVQIAHSQLANSI
jgi:hypothetical protein